MKQYLTVCIDEQQLPDQLVSLTIWAAQKTALPIQLIYRTATCAGVMKDGEARPEFEGHNEAIEPLLHADEHIAQAQLEQEQTMLQPIHRQLCDAGLTSDVMHIHHGTWKQTLSEYQESTDLFMIENHHGMQEKLPDYLESVMTSTQTDLLIAQRQTKAPSRCIVAFDGRSHNLAFIRKILLMPLLHSMPLDLVIVNANEEERHYFQDAEAYWVANGKEVSVTELQGNVAQELANYQLSRPDSLLVISASPHSRFLRFWLGSHTKDILCAAEGPVLIISNQQ
ncbi:universal stress protein [Vibrio palustris]|uniref:Universal stress protein family protein n=1 Tax=Vibrio palustris TaxID=1918946 RepID=A0A1R4B6J8_9VIBR|nr:universal stress protein [Vibrio palustris]SJL84545.1 Universal stress protein family protein [Vibrio palustris]